MKESFRRLLRFLRKDRSSRIEDSRERERKRESKEERQRRGESRNLIPLVPGCNPRQGGSLLRASFRRYPRAIRACATEAAPFHRPPGINYRYTPTYVLVESHGASLKYAPSANALCYVARAVPSDFRISRHRDRLPRAGIVSPLFYRSDPYSLSLSLSLSSAERRKSFSPKLVMSQFLLLLAHSFPQSSAENNRKWCTSSSE